MDRLRHHSIRAARQADDRGVSLVVVAGSLLVVALLVLVALKATGTGGAGSATRTPTQAAGAADAAVAQQNLQTGLTSVEQTDAGGQGTADPSNLQASNPSISFTSGPSTGPGTVSVASTDGSAVTLAARSSDGTCWVVWWAPTGGTWFGAQPGQASCTAPALATAPTAGPATSSTIGWQQGGYPAA